MSTLPSDVAPKLTWITVANSRIRTAHLGTVRVGFVEQRTTGRWLWNLSMIPAAYAAHPAAVEDDEQTAREMLAGALAFWIDSAGLRLL